jgi:hypothetical protein
MKTILILTSLLGAFSNQSFASDAICAVKVTRAVIAIELSDADHSGTISREEALNAYDNNAFLDNDIGDVLPAANNSDFIGKGALTYLLKYSDPLPAGSFGDASRFAWWLSIYTLPTTHLDATYDDVLQGMKALYCN